jgi:hypothetical protein
MTTQATPPVAVVSSNEIQKRIDDMLKLLDPTMPEFNALAADYVTLLEQLRTQVRAESEGAITTAKDSLATMITAAVENLKLPALLDEVVTKVMYTFTPAVEKDGDTPAQAAKAHVTLNPSGKATATRRASTGGNGDRRNLIEIFEANATDGEQAKMAELTAKYGEGGPEADPKKFNSNTWGLKNTVANRVDKENLPSSMS